MGAAVLVTKVRCCTDPWAQPVADAGHASKRARFGELDLGYVEGPDAGPPLLLLHAQLMDWFYCRRVLPALAEGCHVFVVDHPGRGITIYPVDCPMTGIQIGADHAANRSELVRAIVLEDPPIFASEYPRITQAVAIKAFASDHAAVADPDCGGDFLPFWITANKQLFGT